MPRKKKGSKNYIVVQGNDILGLVTGLNVVDIKVLKFIISKIFTNDRQIVDTAIRVAFTKKEFCEAISMDEKNLKLHELEEILKNLFRAEYKIADTELVFHWINNYMPYTSSVGQKGFEVEVSLVLKPYLQHLDKNFTQYDFRHLSKMASSYSIIAYENILKEMKGRRSTLIRKSINEFKCLLGIDNMDKYKDKSSLSRLVKRVVADINLNTELTVGEIRTICESRLVVGYELHVRDFRL